MLLTCVIAILFTALCGIISRVAVNQNIVIFLNLQMLLKVLKRCYLQNKNTSEEHLMQW